MGSADTDKCRVVICKIFFTKTSRTVPTLRKLLEKISENMNENS
jgi:hypothetical protein